MTWKELIRLIKANHVIPVIGKQLYQVEKKVGNSTYNLLYDYLAKVVSSHCKKKPSPDEDNKFAAACRQFLEDYQKYPVELSRLLETETQKIRLIPTNPLLKFARIKNFNIFLNTTYDDFLTRTLEEVRTSPTDTLSYTKYENQLNSLDYKTFKEIQDSKRNLVFHIFGTFKCALPAYTERSLIETITTFHKDIERYQDANLVRKLLSSHLLFLGFEYDDWLFRYLINTLSSTALEKESFKLLIADIFKNKNSPQDPFQKTLQVLKKSGAVGFYPTDDDDGNFIDLLLERMQDREKVIPIKDFPGTVFISFAGKDRLVAKKFADQLRKDGISVWLDKNRIRGGDNIDETIIKAINRSHVFIPLTSQHSTQITENGKIKYHIKEWEYALSRYLNDKESIRIIPVVLDSIFNIYKEFQNFNGYQIPNGTDGDYEKLRKQLQAIQAGIETGIEHKLPRADKGTEQEYNLALALEIKNLEQRGEKEKASQLRMELIDKNTRSTNIYIDEAKYLIEQSRYWDAISIIEKAVRRNCADSNTQVLKNKIVDILSNDAEQIFKKKSGIIYPVYGEILGREEESESAAEILDKIPIITVFGITGIGKSVFINEIRKKKSHNSRLYKRLIVTQEMTVNDVFVQLSSILGFSHMVNKIDFDLSKQSKFKFLEKQAQYRIASLIHLDDAQSLFYKNRFRDPAIKELILAITKYYPETRFVLESQVAPPEKIFPIKFHKTIRLHGIHKGRMNLYLHYPYKDNPEISWEFNPAEWGILLKNLCGIEEKDRVHPLGMSMLAKMAIDLNKTPVEILTEPEAKHKFINESENIIFTGLKQILLQSADWNISRNIAIYREDTPIFLSDKLNEYTRVFFGDIKPDTMQKSDTLRKSYVDHLENEMRSVISNTSSSEGWIYLKKIMTLDKQREERLKQEFGFIYNFDDLDGTKNNREQKDAQSEWRRKIWQVMSMRNNFKFTTIDRDEKQVDKAENKEEKTGLDDGIIESKGTKKKKTKKSSEETGEELERATLKLFNQFFEVWEQDNTFILEKASQQGRGLQNGHDLKFVCCEKLGNKKLRFLIECKNVQKKITLNAIAGKLMAVEDYHHIIPIDHWILISPNANVSNELEKKL